MYLVFDLLYLNKEDLMGLPLVRRREILKKLLPKEGSIRFSDAMEGRGIQFFRAARENEVWRGSWPNEKGAHRPDQRQSTDGLPVGKRALEFAAITHRTTEKRWLALRMEFCKASGVSFNFGLSVRVTHG